MKQFYFLDNSGLLKTSIHLQGDFVIAYSLRLWKADECEVELIEDIRGSCFNNSCKEICYGTPKLTATEGKYYIELDSNITTINTLSEYSIKLTLAQESSRGMTKLLGEEETNGIVGFNDGGKYAKLGITLNPSFANKMAG
jgi:hypothetical protein